MRLVPRSDLATCAILRNFSKNGASLASLRVPLSIVGFAGRATPAQKAAKAASAGRPRDLPGPRIHLRLWAVSARGSGLGKRIWHAAAPNAAPGAKLRCGMFGRRHLRQWL